MEHVVMRSDPHVFLCCRIGENGLKGRCVSISLVHNSEQDPHLRTAITEKQLLYVKKYLFGFERL
jgi:hypothetical protein